MCSSWRDSFVAFLTDMGKRPSSAHSIERINVNGDYEPSNCIWATASQQANNKRETVRLTVRGKTRTLSEWSDISGIPYATLQARLKRNWSAAKAVSTPIQTNRRNRFYQPK